MGYEKSFNQLGPLCQNSQRRQEPLVGEDAWFDIRRLTTVLEHDVFEGTQLVVRLQKILGASPVYDHIVG
jgi:hypothetical protein